MTTVDSHSNYLCPFCKGEITKSVVEGYFGQCEACDEDFYNMELIEKSTGSFPAPAYLHWLNA